MTKTLNARKSWMKKMAIDSACLISNRYTVKSELRWPRTTSAIKWLIDGGIKRQTGGVAGAM